MRGRNPSRFGCRKTPERIGGNWIRSGTTLTVSTRFTLHRSRPPASARALVDAGCRIHRALNEQVQVRHPEKPEINDFSYTMFIDNKPDGEMLGATVLPPGRFDRSPCGTGNSARLALRHARGEVKVGETEIARSIIDSRFEVTLKEETTLAGRPAVIPQIAGRGWIHGMHQIGLDPSDPYPEGFLLSDSWGDAFDLLN